MNGTNDMLLVLVVYITTFVTGFPMNILALCTFISKIREKPLTIDILLMNLTVSDLLLLLFLPFRMNEAASEFKWCLPYFLCPLTAFIFYSSIYISILFLTAVSVDRFISVAYPMEYKAKMKPVYAIMASVFFWIVTYAHCSLIYVADYNGPVNKSNNICYDEFSEQQLNIVLPLRLEMFVLLFCIPLIITTFAYSKFIRILKSLPQTNKEKKKRAIVLVMVTLTVYVVCFAPYNISHVYGFKQHQSPHWRKYVLLLSTVNTALDPIIFYFSSTTVKKSFRHIFGGIVGGISSLWMCKKGSS
ncbi:free fatty acid receptor 3-like [Protopterus annectens]|uniref:free fatty acid receptor 3-like n=1 Tax=Protopterus annectens TaxID=7888 RepID=UPI001CFAA934|nr:free fatty acid receptor 3-like [Protopterus annectens]